MKAQYHGACQSSSFTLPVAATARHLAGSVVINLSYFWRGIGGRKRNGALKWRGMSALFHINGDYVAMGQEAIFIGG